MSQEVQLISEDFQFSERVIEDLQVENLELKKVISSQRYEHVKSPGQPITRFDTKAEKHYSLPIRRLYYELLANQVPASKVSILVKSVVKCFFPDVDISTLQLPKERCAGYMRREELCTVEMAHKAHHFCSEIESGKLFHLNSDGTTLNQHKINGAAINDIVLSLNEVSDGSAESAIQDIEKELNKLRIVASQLNLPLANSINWTLFASSTSDSASTQKKFNKLLEERIAQDELKYGSYKKDGLELVKNFCAMHLGVNLRKVFVQSVSSSNSGNCHQNTQVDTFVHEFAKQFGSHGTPEYCVGNVKFPDFIKMQYTQSSENSEYFKKCLTIHLERQVGSHYFVTAANASKALFLACAALEYFKFNGVSETNGNKLEKELYLKLQDQSLLASVKADALMFYFVYADLVTLAKSNELEKSSYDMRIHYLELQVFLEEVEKHPKITSERYRRVFTSEPRLYSSSVKTNHRLKNQCVWDFLFNADGSDFDEDFFSIMSAGAISMKEKLMAYASSHLPGGEFWEPDTDVRSVLSAIKPTNDLCESILGLNDYLSTALPNLDQATRSTLVGVKKNKTIKWLSNLSESNQDDVTLLAMKSRQQTNTLHKQEKEEVGHKRQQLMLQAKKCRDALKKKAGMEQEKLSKVHVITSVAELEELLQDIDSNNCSNKSKIEKKVKMLREQVTVRKKFLNQKIGMTFTQSGRRKPLNVLIDEFKDVIICNRYTRTGEESCNYNPLALVGKHISHKFICEDRQEEIWFEGFIVGYNAATKMHELAYIEEEENFYYDLTTDLQDGDIIFLDDDN